MGVKEPRYENSCHSHWDPQRCTNWHRSFFCKIDWTALARAQSRSLGHIKTRQTGGGWFKEIFSLGVQKFFTAVQLLFMADLGKTSIKQQSFVIWIMRSWGHTLGPWYLKALHIHAMASWINDEFYFKQHYKAVPGHVQRFVNLSRTDGLLQLQIPMQGQS